MKAYKIVKTVLHLVLAILLFIFYKQLVEYVPFLVGGVMFLYAVEVAVPLIVEKEAEEKDQRILEVFLLILFGILMMALGSKNFATACVIWATWSIYREGLELIEKVKSSKRLWVGILNALESIVCIVFSIMLISEPGHHHALTHVILLGIELTFAVMIPIIDTVKFKKTSKKASK